MTDSADCQTSAHLTQLKQTLTPVADEAPLEQQLACFSEDWHAQDLLMMQFRLQFTVPAVLQKSS